MEKTIWWLFSSKITNFYRVTKLVPEPLRSWVQLVHCLFAVHNGGHTSAGIEPRTAFDDHYSHVKSIVPKENLLEFGLKFE